MMNYITRTLLMLLSAALYSMAVLTLNPVLGFIVLIPAFYVLFRCHNWSSALLWGCVWGAASAFAPTYWMLDGLMLFSGGAKWIGLLAYILAIAVISIYIGITATGIFLINKKAQGVATRIIGITLFMTIIEAAINYMLTALPFYQLNHSYTQLGNHWLLQYAEYGGERLVSLLTVAVNLILYHIIFEFRKTKQTILLAASAILIQAGGWLILQVFLSRSGIYNFQTKAALIRPELDVDMVWNAQNGHYIANKLFAENAKALKHDPDIIFWYEGILPWPYEKDDDFIKEIQHMNTGRKSLHLLGMERAGSGTTTQRNTMFLFNFMDSSIQTYDKTYLIGVAEKAIDLWGLTEIRFTHSAHYEAGVTEQPLLHINGHQAGVVICNENLQAKSFSDKYKGGRQPVLFFVPGNDAWFRKSRILLNVHYHINKIRAIENRTNILVNFNMGLSGFINSSGESYHNNENVYMIKELRSHIF